MSDKPGRNDLCPCGSGKKYKKCCESKGEVLSINLLLENEIADLHKKIVQYSVTHYEKEIEKGFKSFLEAFDLVDKEEMDFYLYIHAVWFTLFQMGPREDGKTIMEVYIQKEKNRIKRPKLKSILETWDEPIIIAGTLGERQGSQGIITDILTGEIYPVDFLQYEPVGTESSFFFGMIVPYEDKYIYYPIPVEIENADAVKINHYLTDQFKKSGLDTEQVYLIQYFMEILYMLPRMGVKVAIADFVWTDPIYQEVAEIFQQKMDVTGELESHSEMGVSTWNIFCHEHPKKIKNPNNYAAALHYLITSQFSYKYTLKDISELYGVSSKSLSTIVKDLQNFIYDHSNEIDEKEILMEKNNI